MHPRSDLTRALGRSLLLVLAAILIVAVASAQQTRRTETGKVTADLIEYDFARHAFSARGNTHVSLDGRHQADIRAPSLSMNLSESMNQILRIEAAGPVRFEVLTAPDENGTRRRIKASASQSATYRHDAQTVVLSGNARADVTSEPPDGAEAAQFSGESITVNLETSMLSVRQATIEVTTEIDAGGGQ